MMHEYQKEQDDDSDDWNDIPMAAQRPNSSSPSHHLAEVPSFGVKQLDFVDHVVLTNKEQKRLIKESQKYTNELTDQLIKLALSHKVSKSNQSHTNPELLPWLTIGWQTKSEAN